VLNTTVYENTRKPQKIPLCTDVDKISDMYGQEKKGRGKSDQEI